MVIKSGPVSCLGREGLHKVQAIWLRTVCTVAPSFQPVFRNERDEDTYCDWNWNLPSDSLLIGFDWRSTGHCLLQGPDTSLPFLRIRDEHWHRELYKNIRASHQACSASGVPSPTYLPFLPCLALSRGVLRSTQPYADGRSLRWRKDASGRAAACLVPSAGDGDEMRGTGCGVETCLGGLWICCCGLCSAVRTRIGPSVTADWNWNWHAFD